MSPIVVFAILMSKIKGLASGIRNITIGSNNQSLDFVTNTRQQECLKKAKMSLEQALLAAQLNELQDLISIDVKSSILALDELTGELITDNILDNIFEHFCIGK